jgi:hypothetical protein
MNVSFVFFISTILENIYKTYKVFAKLTLYRRLLLFSNYLLRHIFFNREPPISITRTEIKFVYRIEDRRNRSSPSSEVTQLTNLSQAEHCYERKDRRERGGWGVVHPSFFTCLWETMAVTALRSS